LRNDQPNFGQSLRLRKGISVSRNVASSPDQPMTMDAAFLTGAVSALRRRAARQAAKARAGTARTEGGVAIRTGEAAIASRLAGALGVVKSAPRQPFRDPPIRSHRRVGALMVIGGAHAELFRAACKMDDMLV
jgi:hypothetical protein